MMDLPRTRRLRPLAAVLAVLPLLSGCGDEDVPVGLDETELTFLRFDPASVADVPTEASIWAVRGEERELVLRSTATGEEILELEIDEESLLRRPDGTPFAEGDSVLIVVTRDPGGLFRFDFQPAGLVFDPDEPAELSIRYVLADGDFDGDGDIDDDDLEFEESLAIWKQESPGDPWVQLLSLEVDDDELEADVDGFTGFALAN